jgi:hypothetical protein
MPFLTFGKKKDKIPKVPKFTKPLFSNNKKTKPMVVDTNYIEWEKDLGFLTLLMSRKKNIIKNYFINVFKTQLGVTDYIRDEDLEEVIQSSVSEVFEELSENYKEYLTTKYFGSDSGLIKFITEDFYVELTSAAIVQNNEKIKLNSLKKAVGNLSPQKPINEVPADKPIKRKAKKVDLEDEEENE